MMTYVAKFVEVQKHTAVLTLFTMQNLEVFNK